MLGSDSYRRAVLYDSMLRSAALIDDDSWAGHARSTMHDTEPAILRCLDGEDEAGLFSPAEVAVGGVWTPGAALTVDDRWHQARIVLLSGEVVALRLLGLKEHFNLAGLIFGTVRDAVESDDEDQPAAD